MNTKDLEEKEELESTPQAEEQIDYKGELEKTKELLEKKNKQLGQAEHVIETLKKEPKEEAPTNIDPVDIDRLINEKMESFTNQVRGDAINNMINSYSSSSDEAELIKFHLENSIRSSGDDEADILNAKALANKTKFVQQASEMKRAEMKSTPDKETTAGEKQTSKPKKVISKEDQRIAGAFGLTQEEIEGGYKR